MKLGLMNFPKNDLFKEIKNIKELGFDFVDITLEYPKCHPSMLDPVKVSRFLDKNSMPAVGHTFWGFPFISPYLDLREITSKELILCIDFFSRANIKLMNVHLDKPFFLFKDNAFQWYYTLLNKLVLEGKKKNVDIMLEHTSGDKEYLELYEKLLRIVPTLKIHFDVGHANLGNNPTKLLDQYLKKYKKRLVHIHISDNKGEKDEHLPLREGNINWTKIVKILKKHKYDKTITLEIFNGGTKGVLKSKRYIEKLLKR